jgi:plastocyanin
VRKRFWLLLAFLVLAFSVASGCGSSSDMTGPVGGGADVVITINGMNGANSFSPNPANVQVGKTVAWRNADSMTHTATQNGTGFNTGNIAPGKTSAPITMGSVGALDYHCNIHPTMTGTLNVTN